MKQERIKKDLKTSEAQLKANRKFRGKVQEDEEARNHRNKLTTLRSARNHIRNYSDEESLLELEKLIQEKRKEMNQRLI